MSVAHIASSLAVVRILPLLFPPAAGAYEASFAVSRVRALQPVSHRYTTSVRKAYTTSSSSIS